MRRVLIINLGWEQAPLIDRLLGKEDCEFFGIHFDDRPYRQSAFEAVHTCDSRDLVSMMRFSEEISPDAVISDECDYSLFAQAVISERFALPGPSVLAAQLGNNKYLQRQRADEKEILIPAYTLCTTMDDVEAFAELNGFPLIVKPIDNRGSFGVVKIESMKELAAGFWEALIHSHSRQVIAEDFIEGVHITIDGYAFSEIGPKSLALATKKLAEGHAQVAVDIVYPGELEVDTFKKAMSVNEIVNRELGYSFGMTHSEYMVRNDEVYLIESANRGGGVFTSELIVPFTARIDLLEQYIADCLGEDCDNYKIPVHDPVVLRFFSFDVGRVAAIEGWSDINSHPGVLACDLFIGQGDTISAITSDANRHGFFILKGNSEDAEKLLNSVRIRYA